MFFIFSTEARQQAGVLISFLKSKQGSKQEY
jgi:hypothetical protein